MADINNLNVLVICGSLRKASYNAMVANSLPALAPAGMKITPSPTIVMPLYNAEYNYSIPGVLKNAIDWVSRLPNQPFANKPVAIQSASQGPLGGPRMQYHLRQCLIFNDAFTLNKPEIFVGGVKAKVDEAKGVLTDEPTREIIKQQLAGFAKFIVRVSG